MDALIQVTVEFLNLRFSTHAEEGADPEALTSRLVQKTPRYDG
jgi:hypothetical protein